VAEIEIKISRDQAYGPIAFSSRPTDSHKRRRIRILAGLD